MQSPLVFLASYIMSLARVRSGKFFSRFATRYGLEYSPTMHYARSETSQGEFLFQLPMVFLKRKKDVPRPTPSSLFHVSDFNLSPLEPIFSEKLENYQLRCSTSSS